MTVLNIYAPIVRDKKTDEQLRYWFDWEWISEDQIEVYEVDQVAGTRTLVPKQDYYIKGEAQIGDRGPTKTEGNVYFNRPHADNISHISIERNSLIVQVTDMPNVRAFNTRVMEQALDYTTMICQEMVQRKCGATTSVPITQEIIFGSYRVITAWQVDAALNKLAKIINEISTTAADCSDTPEEA